MDDHDDFAQEPVKGLPEALPPGETILWQGRPDIWALAREAFAIRAVAVWFVLLFFWRMISVSDLVGWGAAAADATLFLVMGAVVCLILLVLARTMAKLSVYSITNRRVVMRIGAALTITLNFPFSKIAAANLELRRDGTGTIALKTLGTTRFSYLVLWPHTRPWRIARTEPALRCIPEAAKVARLLAEVAEPEIAKPQISRVSDTQMKFLAAE